MDKLPMELLSRIVDYLSPRELSTLQLVSKQFFAISRDNRLWRLHCYESISSSLRHSRTETTSTALNTFRWRRASGSDSINLVLAPRNTDNTGTNDSIGDCGLSQNEGWKIRSAAEWDPSYEGENVNWFSEYVARHGPISINWFSQPYNLRVGGVKRVRREVKGMGFLRDWSPEGSDKVVGPLDDGTVCIWDLNRSSQNERSTRGRIAGISSPGILLTDMPRSRDPVASKSTKLDFIGVGECVSVDSMRQKAYIAVGNVLNEVDLYTLKVISQEKYAWSIFALSQETDYSAPLTVGTTLSLQLYDSRYSARMNNDDNSLRCENDPNDLLPVLPKPTSASSSANLRLFNPPPADYAPLFQPGPLSILHPPAPNINSILLAGRFPSILLYDRRFFPRLQDAAHSGARLCGFAAIPAPPRTPSSDWSNHHTIVACGEYNGRGSLEFFTLSSSPKADDSGKSSPLGRTSVYQNRQSASRSKLLSVASHGTRLVYSDADGNIKWVERDGRTMVRSWNINADARYGQRPPPTSQKHAPRQPPLRRESSDGAVEISDRSNIHMEISSFEPYSRTGADVARKVLPTGRDLADNEVLIWTGERIGRVRFSPYRDLLGNEDDTSDEGEQAAGEEVVDGVSSRNLRRQKRKADEYRQREYAETMRRALWKHAEELYWLASLGVRE